MKTSKVCTTAGFRRLSTDRTLIHKGKVFLFRRNQGRIREVGLKRFEIVLPLEVGIKADYLGRALQCTQAELFSRLLIEEWHRQGEPVSFEPKHPA
jgi:hypothetical protein